MKIFCLNDFAWKSPARILEVILKDLGQLDNYEEITTNCYFDDFKDEI